MKKEKYDVTKTILLNELRKTKAMELNLRKSDSVEPSLEKKISPLYSFFCCTPRKPEILGDSMERGRKIQKAKAVEQKLDKNYSKKIRKLFLKRTYMGKELFLCYMS